MVAGVIPGAIGVSRYEKLQQDTNKVCSGTEVRRDPECRISLAKATSLRWGGGFTLGAGAATMVTGSVAFVRRPRVRFGGWIVTAALGGSVLGLGAWLSTESRGQFVGVVKDSGITSWNPLVLGAYKPGAWHTVGGVMTGFGAGLLVGSTIGLIDTAIGRRGRAKVARKKLTFAPLTQAQLGLSVSGRF